MPKTRKQRNNKNNLRNRKKGGGLLGCDDNCKWRKGLKNASKEEAIKELHYTVRVGGELHKSHPVLMREIRRDPHRRLGAGWSLNDDRWVYKMETLISTFGKREDWNDIVNTPFKFETNTIFIAKDRIPIHILYRALSVLNLKRESTYKIIEKLIDKNANVDVVGPFNNTLRHKILTKKLESTNPAGLEQLKEDWGGESSDCREWSSWNRSYNKILELLEEKTSNKEDNTKNGVGKTISELKEEINNQITTNLKDKCSKEVAAATPAAGGKRKTRKTRRSHHTKKRAIRRRKRTHRKRGSRRYRRR